MRVAITQTLCLDPRSVHSRAHHTHARTGITTDKARRGRAAAAAAGGDDGREDDDEVVSDPVDGLYGCQLDRLDVVFTVTRHSPEAATGSDDAKRDDGARAGAVTRAAADIRSDGGGGGVSGVGERPIVTVVHIDYRPPDKPRPRLNTASWLHNIRARLTSISP